MGINFSKFFYSFEDKRSQNIKDYHDCHGEMDDEIIILGRENEPEMLKSWENANFHPTLEKAVKISGYSEPLKVQAHIIPLLVEGYDVIGVIEPNSGVTTAYLLPMINEMLKTGWESKKGKPFGIVVVPTRELANQIHEEANRLFIGTKYRCFKLYGEIDVSGLKYGTTNKGSDIIVTTPGRFCEIMDREYLNINSLRYVIWEESDRLMGDSFIEETINILNPSRTSTFNCRQNLIICRELSIELQNNLKKMTRDKLFIIGNDKKSVFGKNVKHFFVYTEAKDKPKKIADLIKGKTLIYVENKNYGDILSIYLSDLGEKVSSFNSNHDQENREKMVGDFKNGNINILIATDSISEGLQFNDLDRIINIECPKNPKFFIKRVTRIKKGDVITLYGDDDHVLPDKIYKILQMEGQSIPENFISDEYY